jgi:hypothetical protein
MSRPEIDPARTDLAAEYRAQPFGRHSAALQGLLDTMHRAAVCQNLILVQIEPGKWVLGERLPGSKPPHLFMDEMFTTVEAGEWAAFKRRWRALAGTELDIE